MRNIKFLIIILFCRLAPATTVSFTGDIMVAETPGELIAAGKDPFVNFEEILSKSDIRLGNLECNVGTTGKPEIKPFTFQAHPRVIPVLAKHFHALSIANNHSGDFGKAALLEHLDLFRSAGLPLFGGGRNLEEAHTPWIKEIDGIRFAFLGYNEFKPRSFEAHAAVPGIAWSGEDEHVITDILFARSVYKADVVIPFLHWGWEGETTPTERQRGFARRMIDAGADAVVGAHPHLTQGAETYKGRPIIFSLGNYLFNGFNTEETTTGWVLRLNFNKSTLVHWDTIVARLDESGVPKPDLKASSPCGKPNQEIVGSCKGGWQ